jgi:Concanavalin A-like lectin/glucanases superfamily
MPLSILSSSARATLARVVYKRASNVPATAGFYNINNTSLLYYYPFDTNYTDSNGSVNDLTTTGVSITTNYTVLTSGSVTMPKSSAQYIQLPNTLAFQANQGITVSCWYKLNSLSPATGNYARIFDIGDRSGSAVNAFLLLFNGTTSNLYIGYYNNALNRSTPNLYTMDLNWHHLTVTIDTLGNFTLYVDGVSYGSYYLGLPPVVTYSNALIGGANDNAGYMNANMNNFMMFNRVLTPIEIGYLYRYPTLITVTSFATSTPPVDYTPNFPGCTLWLDAADKTTIKFTSGSNTNVTQWNDKSGSGNHFSSYSSTYNPGIGFKKINGYDVMDFSGSKVLQNTTMTITNNIFTIFFVGYAVSPGTSNILFADSTTANGYGVQIGVVNTGWYGYTRAAPSSYYGQNSNFPATSLFMATVTNDGTNFYNYINGSNLFNIVSGTSTATTPTAGFQIGGNIAVTSYFGGYICEFIVYNNVLSTSQRQIIEGYLAWKWGMQTTTTQNSIPQTLTISNPFLWLDGSDYSTMTLSGANVTQWNDKSTNAYNMTQGTSANQPKFGTKQINGRNVVDFSGNAGGLYMSNTAVSLTNNAYTIFIVGYTVYNSASPNILLYGYNTGATGYFSCFSQSNQLYFGVNNGNWNTYGTGTVPTTTPYMFEGINSPTSMQIYYDASLCSNVGYTANSVTLTSINVGSGSAGGSPFNGYIGEVLVYNTTLSPANRIEVEGYLAWKWGLNLLLPTNHKYYLNSLTTPSLPTTHPYFKVAPVAGLQTPTWWYKYLSTDISLNNTTYFVKNYATNAYDASLNINGANGYTGNYLTGMGVDPYNGLGTLTTSMRFGNGTPVSTYYNNQWIQWPTLNTTTTYYTLAFMFKFSGSSYKSTFFTLGSAQASGVGYTNSMVLSTDVSPSNCIALYGPGGPYSGSNYDYSFNAMDLNPHFFTFVFGPPGFTPQFYLDGSNVTNPGLPATFYQITQNVRGFNFDDWNGNSYGFYGWLGETRLYNYAMSASEVQTLYNSVATIYNINNTGLLRYYPFDTNMLDYSTGVGVTDVSLNSGVFLTTAATKLTTGAFNFQSVYAPTFALQPILFQPTGLTIAFWIKPNTTQETIYGRIFAFRQGTAWGAVTGSHDVVLNWANSSNPYNLLTFSYSTGASNQNFNYVTTVTALDTNWHHICITVTPTGLLSIYIDNVLNATNTAVNGNFIDTSLPYNNFFLGKDSSTDTTYFTNAYMNSFAVFNRVLTTTEIGYLYGVPKQIQFTSAPTTNTLTFGTVTQPFYNLPIIYGIAVAINAAGNRMIYVSYGGNAQYSTLTGSTWSAFTNITGSSVLNYTGVAMSADGTRIVIGVRTGSMYYASWPAANSAPGSLTAFDSTARYYSQIDMTPDGSRVVVAVGVGFVSPSEYIYYSDWNTGTSTYNTLTQITSVSPTAYGACSITPDKSIIAYATTTAIYYVKWNGTTYANPVAISVGGITQVLGLKFTYDAKTLFSTNTVSGTGSPSYMLYYSSWNGTSFNTFTGVSSTNSTLTKCTACSLTLDGSNNIYFSDSGYDGTNPVIIYKVPFSVLDNNPPVTINSVTPVSNNVYATGQSVSDGITYNVYCFTSSTTTGQNGYTINYTCNKPTNCYMLAIAGGGSGSWNSGGGGGAGGVIMMPVSLSKGTSTITISVGAGAPGINSGNGVTGYNTTVTFNSTSTTYTAWGGGGGGTGASAGLSGGSGGGGGTASGAVYAGGASISYGYNYGNPGGTGIATTGTPNNNGSNGGGGGAGTIGLPGALGSANNAQNGGNGGSGIQCFLPGVRDYVITSPLYPTGIKVSNLYWAGGGGGGAANGPSTAGNGGIGGGGGGSHYSGLSSTTFAGIGGTGGLNKGGDGGYTNNAPAGNAGAGGTNTGSGGGASYGYVGSPAAYSGAGGSGIVILAFPVTSNVVSTSTPVLSNPAVTSTGYNSLQCAFSCRLLNSNYYGPTITLRCEGDSVGNYQQNFYADIYGNLGTGYNGTGLSVYQWLLTNGATSTNYAYVSKWYDQAMDASFNNANQITNASQPIYDVSNGLINFGYTSGVVAPSGWTTNAGNRYLSLPDGAFPYCPSTTYDTSYTFIQRHGQLLLGGGVNAYAFYSGGVNATNALLTFISFNGYDSVWSSNDYQTGAGTSAANQVVTNQYQSTGTTTVGTTKIYVNTSTSYTGARSGTGIRQNNSKQNTLAYLPSLSGWYGNYQLYYLYVSNLALSVNNDTDRKLLENTPYSLTWANKMPITMTTITTNSFTATWSYSGASTYTTYINNNLYGNATSGQTFYPNSPAPWNIKIFAYNSGGTLLATGSQSSTIQDPSLIFYYKFKTTDLSGGLIYNYANNRYDASLNSTSATIATGTSYNTAKINSSLSLQSATQAYVKINTPFSFSPRGFTFACWFSTSNSSTGGYQRLFYFTDSASGTHTNDLLLNYPSYNYPYIAITNGGSAYEISMGYTTSVVSDTTWRHLAVVINYASASPYNGILYLNGSQVSTFSSTNFPDSNIRDNNYIGWNPFGISLSNNSFFVGYMNEWRTYNRALSADEIATLYAI